MRIRTRIAQLGLIGVAVVAVVTAAVVPGAIAARKPARTGAHHGSQASSATWATYHFNAQRSGYDPSQPTFASVKLGWANPAAVDGAVYAEPLIVGNTVVIATENNSVYGLDVATGNQLWHANLGSPVPQSSLQCGNIDPVGITGTPVIDPAAGVVYAVGLVQVSSNTIQYQLAAMSLASGAIIYQKPITFSGLDPTDQSQRAALSLLNGFVYIPFGGYFGDCGQYHGWLVETPTNANNTLFVFQTSQDYAGGLWQPAGASVDALGNLYVTSGNTDCPSPCSTNDGGNNVFRLSPNTRPIPTIACPISGCVYRFPAADYFAPTNYASLDNNDVDLGSTGPLPVNGGLIFQVGKAGDGYLLHTSNLGQVGGQAFEAHVCPNLTNDAAFGGDAYADPYIYVPCNNGVVAITLNSTAPSFAFAWHGPTTGGADPPIVAGGYVWTFNNGGGHLYALNPTTGTVFYDSGYIGGGEHFATPAAGDGAVIVAAGTQIYSFVNGG